MKNCFKKNELKACIDTYAAYPEELARCVYTSRLIGSNSGLVLHGGGNTSVKLKSTDIFGEEIDIVYVKGSGSDLAAINPDDFTG
ncbi:MAG: class II aldolase/adducin family protein, partial [Desulfobacterales bacterium]|nr:class II aldolase/adducin family protein [Desulfobacterales bacterium]